MKLYKKLAITLCLLTSSSSFCTGMDWGTNLDFAYKPDVSQQYEEANNYWNQYLNNSKNNAFVTRAIELATTAAKSTYTPALELLGRMALHIPEATLAYAEVNYFSYQKYLRLGLPDADKLYNLALGCAHTLIKDEDASLKDKAYLLLSQIYYDQGKFDEGFDCLCTLFKARNIMAQYKMLEIFLKSPEAVKHFNQKLELMNIDRITRTDAYLQIAIPFLDGLYVRQDIGEQLDDITQEEIGVKYHFALNFQKDPDRKEIYLSQMIRRFLLSAKQGNEGSLNRLLSTILKFKAQETFYNHLLPFLKDGDDQAKNLFNEICFKELFDHKSRTIYDYLSNVSLKFLNDETNPKILKILDGIINNYEDFKSRKNGDSSISFHNFSDTPVSAADSEYNNAIALWEEAPHDALGRLREAEKLGSMEAKAKFKEVRNSPSYKEPHKVKEDDKRTDHGVLLKRDDEVEAKNKFEIFNSQFLKKVKKNNFSNKDIATAAAALCSANELGNPAAKEQVKKLKKSKGYRDAEKGLKDTKSTDPYYRLATQFHSLEGVKTYIKGGCNDNPSTQKGSSQKSTPNTLSKPSSKQSTSKTPETSLSPNKQERTNEVRTMAPQSLIPQNSASVTPSISQKEITAQELLNLAKICVKGKKIEEAKQHLKAAYDKEGNIEAAFRLGGFWMHKDNCNLEEAEKYLKIAHDKGHPHAWDPLSSMYQDQRKLKEAKEYLEFGAIRQNAPYAQFNLGGVCLQEKNFKEARKYLKLAAENKDLEPRAIFYIGETYADENNPKKAMEFYNLSAQLGHLDAQDKIRAHEEKKRKKQEKKIEAKKNLDLSQQPSQSREESDFEKPLEHSNSSPTSAEENVVIEDNIGKEKEKEKISRTLPHKKHVPNLTRRNSENQIISTPKSSEKDNESIMKGLEPRKGLSRTQSFNVLSVKNDEKAQNREEKSREKSKDKNHTNKKGIFDLFTSTKYKDKRSEKKSSQSFNITIKPIQDDASTKSKGEGSKSRRSSISSQSEETSEKESKKLRRKSSSSSLTPSEESSVEGETPTDSLVKLNYLPKEPKDYFPRHDKLLHSLLSQKFDLDAEDKKTLWVILTGGEYTFEINTTNIKDLCSNFKGFTKKIERGKGGHEVIRGMGITLNPNADGIKKGSYDGQIEQARNQIIKRIARTLTEADRLNTQEDKPQQDQASLTTKQNALTEGKK